MLLRPSRAATAAILSAALTIHALAPALAQSGDAKSGDQSRAAGAQAPEGGGKEGQNPKKVDEFAEAAQALSGAAGNPECVWLGRRAVSLLWRDDLDTAFRHLEIYDRFGCPGGHIQVTFRCVVRQGNIDPKAPESLAARVHACWINPDLAPQPTQAAQAPQTGEKAAKDSNAPP